MRDLNTICLIALFLLVLSFAIACIGLSELDERLRRHVRPALIAWAVLVVASIVGATLSREVMDKRMEARCECMVRR